VNGTSTTRSSGGPLGLRHPAYPDRPTELVAAWDCGKLHIYVYCVPGDEYDSDQYYRHSTWRIANGDTWSSGMDLSLGTDPTRFIEETERQWRKAYKPAPLPKPTQLEMI